MESESVAAGAVPPEQELTEVLLSLSWPLPRTVQDADAALTRLEEVKAVLTQLEQQSVGTDAWWAGQVDGLATQIGFVLEWWRPVLRDPDLDWTLNHQAHLTADLATLASAGARLLDQIEPRAAEEAAAAAHARRVEQDKRWGPAAVPALAPTGQRPHAPGARPQPPGEIFGEPAERQASQSPVTAPSTAAAPSPSTAQGSIPAPAVSVAPAPPPIPAPAAAPAASAPPPVPGPAPVPVPPPIPAPAAAAYDAPPVAAPPSISAQEPVGMAAATASPAPAPAPAAAPPTPPVDASPGSARHRRPAYDFDDSRQPTPAGPPPAAYPSTDSPPRSPLVPGPGFGGPSSRGRTLAPGGYPPPSLGYPAASHSGPGSNTGPGHGPGIGPPPGSAPGPFGFTGEDDDDEPDSLVPTGLGLRRHQRRLLIQTGAILGAIGVLCWWAVYTLGSSPSQASAAGDATHTGTPSAATTDGGGGGASTAAGGLTTDHSAAPTPSKSTETTPSSAPSTATSSVPDATTVSSVRVTLLGGSSTVPQIVALITVNTAGAGQVTVTGSYYGASGSKQVAAETERWTLSGKTSYQYSVPIANSAYCGTEFHFTVSAGGHSESDETAPGC